jgi:hypothetical protein
MRVIKHIYLATFSLPHNALLTAYLKARKQVSFGIRLFVIVGIFNALSFGILSFE